MSLEGKVAVVTGATSEIGQATAIRLAAEGASVAVTGKTPEKLDRVVEDLRKAGATLYAAALDLSVPETAERFFAEVADRLGPVDILVNTAAWRKPKPLLELTPTDWRRTLAVSLDSHFFCSLAAAKQMVPRRWGRIIHYGSISGSVLMSPFLPYTAAKGAVHALVKALAVELAPFNISVNAVSPGPVETEHLRTHLSAAAIERRIDRIPAGRLATPEDCAAAAVHLAAPDMGFVTGQILYVDGGFLSAGVIAK